MRTLLHLNGMTGLSEEVNASPPQMSIERLILSSLELVIGWVRFDSFPDYRINAKTKTQLLLRKLGEPVGQQMKLKNIKTK